VIPERPRFLTVAQISELADWLAEEPVRIRDVGALVAAALRPAVDVDGERVYRDEYEQAGALMHAIATTRPFDSALNPGIALFVALAVVGVRAQRLDPVAVQGGQRLVRSVAEGLDDVGLIATHLRQIALGEPWRETLPSS
jgi:hypothetical protein